MGADRPPDDGDSADQAGGAQPEDISRTDDADGVRGDRVSAEHLARAAGADVTRGEPRGREEYANMVRADGAISRSTDQPGQDEPQQPALRTGTDSTGGTTALADDPADRAQGNDRGVDADPNGVAEPEDLAAAHADSSAKPESASQHITDGGPEKPPDRVDSEAAATAEASEASEDRPADSQRGGPTDGAGPDMAADRKRETADQHASPDQQAPPGDTETASTRPSDRPLPDLSNEDDVNSDLPRPLTDAEWAEHVTTVCDRLWEERSADRTTDYLHTIDPEHQIWSEERELLHNSIINDLYTKAANVPCEHKAVIAGGLGGAGKTTVLTEHAGINLSQYLAINPDDLKQEMAARGMLPQIDGLSPMEVSDLAHEESSYLARQLALRAQADGKNLIWDITMSDEGKTEGRINELRDAGYYEIDGIFVDIPLETSIRRTEVRHREGHEKYRAGVGLGGRYVPPELIRKQSDPLWGSENRKTFEAVKERLSTWCLYDNSIDAGTPRVVDSGRQEGANPQVDRREPHEQ